MADVSDIFNFFLLGGRGGGVRGDREGGGGSVFYSKSQEGGRVSQEGGGARGPGGCLPGIFWGGLNIFFRGLKCPPTKDHWKEEDQHMIIWGKLFYLQLEPCCLQLSFFAYSPLEPLLDALSHCNQKSSNCEQKS